LALDKRTLATIRFRYSRKILLDLVCSYRLNARTSITTILDHELHSRSRLSSPTHPSISSSTEFPSDLEPFQNSHPSTSIIPDDLVPRIKPDAFMFSTAAPTPTYRIAYFLHSPHAAPKTLQSVLATAWLPGYLPAPNSTVSASSSRTGDWQDEDEIQGVVHYVSDAEQERRLKEHVGVDCEVK
jgi:hypothetical protein